MFQTVSFQVVCPDCELAVVEGEESICAKCLLRRSERKEIITEIVETEGKYGRDLRIIVEEFYRQKFTNKKKYYKMFYRQKITKK